MGKCIRSHCLVRTTSNKSRMSRANERENQERIFTDPEQQEFKEYTGEGGLIPNENKNHRHDTLNRHNLRLQQLQVD